MGPWAISLAASLRCLNVHMGPRNINECAVGSLDTTNLLIRWCKLFQAATGLERLTMNAAWRFCTLDFVLLLRHCHALKHLRLQGLLGGKVVPDEYHHRMDAKPLPTYQLKTLQIENSHIEMSTRCWLLHSSAKR